MKTKRKSVPTIGQRCADRLWEARATVPALTREHVARLIDEEYQRTLAPRSSKEASRDGSLPAPDPANQGDRQP